MSGPEPRPTEDEGEPRTLDASTATRNARPRSFRSSGWQTYPPPAPERVRVELWKASHHEAAHAVAYHLLGVPLVKVAVFPFAEQDGGRCTPLPLRMRHGSGARRRGRHELLAVLAGSVCHAMQGDPAAPCRPAEKRHDLPASRTFLRKLERLGVAAWSMGDLMRDAWRLLSTPEAYAMRQAVARELYARGVVTGGDVHLLCRRARRQVRRERRRMERVAF